MKAYICDHCGKPFPTFNVTKVRAYRNDGNIRRIGDAHRSECIDLCPTCILLIDKWVDNNIRLETEDE